MLVRYEKPALTFQQQLDQLKNRGMVVNNEEKALKDLSCISYYRLSAYWYPFKLRNDSTSEVIDQFVPGTQFEQAIELYEFDRKLRLLVIDAIERVEIMVRTKVTYHLGHTYGAFAHADPTNFHPKFNHVKWLQKLEDEIIQSKDVFITHYKNKYEGFPTIPIWMLTEVMSMGSLSVCYAGLQNNDKLGVQDKKVIADQFNIHYKRLEDWLHTLTYIRNICAHHSRLWNRELAIRPDQSKEIHWRAPITPCNDRIFYILLILRYMLRFNNNGENWVKQISQVIEPIANVNKWRIAMGMPANWKVHPIWK